MVTQEVSFPNVLSKTRSAQWVWRNKSFFACRQKEKQLNDTVFVMENPDQKTHKSFVLLSYRRTHKVFTRLMFRSTKTKT